MARFGYTVRQLKFRTPLPRPETEAVVMQYFSLQKFYKTGITDQLLFKSYYERKSFLSPGGKILFMEISLAQPFKDTEVNCTLYIRNKFFSSIEDDCFEGFLKHFKQAILENKVTSFPIEIYETEGQRYSRVFILAYIITWAVFLIAGIWTKAYVIFLFPLFFARLFSVMSVNWKRDKDMSNSPHRTTISR